MEAYEALMTRRSIRKFEDKPIDENTLKDILDAAMSAPSAHNRQPWEFVIIDDKKILDEIPKLNQYADMCRESPLSILVCGDFEKENSEGFLVQDCSAAIENILLAAHAKGIGSVWTGMHPKKNRIDGLREMLSLPPHILPIGLIVLGYPAEKKGKEKRYDEKKIHRNGW